MYIRRKVFSLLHDETGEERYFSTREILMEDKEEKLFSTLDEEILEQREFGRRQKLARKAQRAAHNAEMHSNKSAKLYWDSKEILNNPKSNVEDLEKVSRNLEKSQRLSNSATREVDDAIKSALKKNPSAPKVPGNMRKIKIGSSGISSGVVNVLPTKSVGDFINLTTNGRRGQPRGGGSGIRAVDRLNKGGGVLSKDPNILLDTIFTRSRGGMDQVTDREIKNQKSRVDKKIRNEKARELGIGRGRGRDYKLREETARLRGDFNARVHDYKSKKAAERALQEELKKKAESEARKAASDLKGNSRTLSENNMVKKGFKLGKGGKIALGTAAAAGLAYGAKKLYDKKKDKE